MDVLCYMYTCFLLLLCGIEVKGRRHMIYWNSFMTPELLSGEDYILHVRIGEFMDILCPQTSLMSITNGLTEPETFDIFNVTRPSFQQCSREGRSNFIFACDRPERENKLTIKFQTISPSPLGFRFQYCEDYFFVASPRHNKNRKPGCHGNNSTRLHIRVACKHPPTSTSSTTTSTTLSSTSTPSLFDVDAAMEENIIRPNLIHPRPQRKNYTVDKYKDGFNEQQAGYKPENSQCRHVISTSLLFMTSLLALVWIHQLTSPFT